MIRQGVELVCEKFYHFITFHNKSIIIQWTITISSISICTKIHHKAIITTITHQEAITSKRHNTLIGETKILLLLYPQFITQFCRL